MAADWQFQSRGEQCSLTGRPFTEGEFFYTLLFKEKGGFRREDLCEEAFQQRESKEKPFSFWRTKYEPPAPPAPEALPKETAEGLFRRYVEENDPERANVRYILALMLERKRLLKQTDVQFDGDDRLLVYERAKTGEVFVIRDPELKLEQLAAVQAEVAELLQG